MSEQPADRIDGAPSPTITPPAGGAPSDGAPSIMPEVAQILREGRMGPASWARIIALALRRGGQRVAEFPEVRRSYAGWAAAVAVVLLACDAWLGRATTPLAGLVVAAVQVAWGAPVLAFGRAQLHLVRDPDGRPFRSFGVANALTLLRLASLPTVFACLVLFPGHPSIGVFTVVVYGFAAGSDLLDGLLARLLRHKTEFGRLWDPVVDIIFNPVTAIALTIAGVVPWWLMLAALYRYWVALLGGVALYVFRGPYKVRPTWIGKLSGLLLALALGAGALELVVAPSWLEGPTLFVLYVTSAVLTGANGVYLMVLGITYRDVRPRGEPTL